MSRLAGQVGTEVLRILYAFTTSRWPGALMEVVVVALIVTFALAAWRLRNSIGSHVPRPVTPHNKEA